MSPELSLVFATPIFSRTLFTPSFNEKLARSVLSHRRNGEGRRLSGGGWQSASDVLNWPDLEVKLLAAEVFDAVERINATGANIDDRNPDGCRSVAAASRVNAASASADCWSPNGFYSAIRRRSPYHGCAWANVNGDGHYNPPRVQAGYQWCAIYHIAMGRPAPDHAMNGMLEFIDPRPAAPFSNLEKFSFGRPLEIEPKPGLVVIFPAWLQHSVHPFFGMGHRISITMNVSLEEE
jgi:hypothetical protein